MECGYCYVISNKLYNNSNKTCFHFHNKSLITPHWGLLQSKNYSLPLILSLHRLRSMKWIMLPLLHLILGSIFKMQKKSKEGDLEQGCGCIGMKCRSNSSSWCWRWWRRWRWWGVAGTGWRWKQVCSTRGWAEKDTEEDFKGGVIRDLAWKWGKWGAGARSLVKAPTC